MGDSPIVTQVTSWLERHLTRAGATPTARVECSPSERQGHARDPRLSVERRDRDAKLPQPRSAAVALGEDPDPGLEHRDGVLPVRGT